MNLRVLLPSWRFFDRATRSPRLLIRRVGEDWRALDELGGPRPLLTPLFAPRANLLLAYQSAIERLVQDLSGLSLESEAADGVERDPKVTELVSYRLVARIAAEFAAGPHEWKVTIPDGDAFEDYIVSPVNAA